MLSREDREAIEGLFDRLDDAERRGGPRDAEAEALIRQKMAMQPAAPYYLAQTVVVQQAALREAERRIEELEGRHRGLERRGGPWDREPVDDNRRQNQAGGGFLAGAAQTALGVAGGMMIGSLIGSIFTTGAANAQEFGGADDPGQDGLGELDDSGLDGGGFDGGFDIGGDF